MQTHEFPKLVFDRPFDERSQYEAKARGYLSHAKVHHADGSVFSVVFYDCARLAQDLEYEVSTGRMCIADPGMIIVPEVTIENMTAAVKKLTAEGFFDHICPLKIEAGGPIA